MTTSVRMILAGAVVALSLVAPVIGAVPPAENPAAMAAQYTKQAAELRASASRHADLAKMHRSGLAGSSKTSHESIAVHCDNIAASLNAAAAETEALAATYKKLAAEQPARK
jgi:hypothetical protein